MANAIWRKTIKCEGRSYAVFPVLFPTEQWPVWPLQTIGGMLVMRQDASASLSTSYSFTSARESVGDQWGREEEAVLVVWGFGPDGLQPPARGERHKEFMFEVGGGGLTTILPAGLRVLGACRSWRDGRLQLNIFSAEPMTRCSLPLSLAVAAVYQICTDISKRKRNRLIWASNFRCWRNQPSCDSSTPFIWFRTCCLVNLKSRYLENALLLLWYIQTLFPIKSQMVYCDCLLLFSFISSPRLIKVHQKWNSIEIFWHWLIDWKFY